MRISDVQAYTLKCPLKKPWRIAGLVMSEMTSTIVEVKSDSGLVGYGEALTRLGPGVTKEVVEAILKPVLIGENPLDVDVLWERMFSTMMSRGHWKGFMIEAISGVDIALWDLNGKILDKPVATLLGGRHHEKLESYASSVMIMDTGEMVEEAKSLIEQGYKKIKFKIGRGVEEDFRYLEAARAAVGPNIGIMADVNSGYSLASALRLGGMLPSLNLLWLEEPLPPQDLDGYARLNESLSVPVAAGESDFTRWGFRDLIIRGKVPVIQPDIARCGGFTEGRKIAALASAHGVTVSPHTGASGAVCIAAAVQFAASLSNLHIFEYMYPENPLREDILREPVLQCDAGFVEVPTGPGLGIEIDPRKIEKYMSQ
jgi:L-alanine-DL-glutamate epimerase-like enolase superfamily enzyme